MVKLNSDVLEKMGELGFPTAASSGKSEADMTSLAEKLNSWMINTKLKPYTRVTYLTRMRKYLDSQGVEKNLVIAARVPNLTMAANSESASRALKHASDEGVDVSAILPLAAARILMNKLVRHKDPFTPVGVADSDVVRMISILQCSLCARVGELRTLVLSDVNGELYVSGVSKTRGDDDKLFRLVSFAADSQIRSAMAKWVAINPDDRVALMKKIKYQAVVKQIYGHPSHILRKIGAQLAVECRAKNGTPLEDFIIRKTALRHAGGIPVTLAHYGNVCMAKSSGASVSSVATDPFDDRAEFEMQPGTEDDADAAHACPAAPGSSPCKEEPKDDTLLDV